MTYFQLYLLTIIPNIGIFSLVVGLLLGSFTAIYIAHLIEMEKSVLKAPKFLIFLAIIFISIGVLTPTKSDLAFIVGGKYLINSEWSKLPDTTAKWLNKTLEQYIEKDEK